MKKHECDCGVCEARGRALEVQDAMREALSRVIDALRDRLERIERDVRAIGKVA